MSLSSIMEPTHFILQARSELMIPLVDHYRLQTKRSVTITDFSQIINMEENYDTG